MRLLARINASLRERRRRFGSCQERDSGTGRFQHDALSTSVEQIRLLRFHPRRDGIIECTLRTFAVDKCPTYEALSYLWGDTDDTGVIRINGAPFAVRRNLWNFLDHFSTGRISHVSEEHNTIQAQYLWIDQICIDQNLLTEKSDQVQRMSAIYTRASRVIIWLGLYTEQTQNLLHTLLEQRRLLRTNILLQTDDWFIGDAVKAVNLLNAHEYWTRLWIVQEVVLAQHLVICFGHHFITYEEFRDIQNMACGRRNNGDSGAPNLELDLPTWLTVYLLAELRAKMEKVSLRVVMRCFHAQKCEDARDKVYGLLPLVHNAERLVVDYSKSVSEVWRDAIALICIDEGVSSAEEFLKSDGFVGLFGLSMGMSQDETGFGPNSSGTQDAAHPA